MAKNFGKNDTITAEGTAIKGPETDSFYSITIHHQKKKS
jgi:hypothetical protein